MTFSFKPSRRVALQGAALALAAHLSGAPAKLLITRKKSSVATFALACAG